MEATLTVDQVMAWRPCGRDGPHDGRNYTRQRVEELWDGRKAVTFHDIMAMNIPGADKLWALARPHWMAAADLALWGCDCAERVLPFYENVYPDRRVHDLIHATRGYVRGEVSLEKLTAAARAAHVAHDAAHVAAYDVAHDAAYAARAAHDAHAERQWQLERLEWWLCLTLTLT